MASSPEEIKKQVKSYLLVFAALLVCTVLTVAVATQEALDFGGHGFDIVDCIVGLAIATLKATLVASVFMHLNHEKKTIYWIFFGSLFFAACLYGLTELAEKDPMHDPLFYNESPNTAVTAEPVEDIATDERAN